MKKVYQNPTLLCVELDREDVIRTSSVDLFNIDDGLVIKWSDL